ncbi:hypothetical protein Phum_PHUM497030 [Pediculus humanus corporis]|uniref:Transmembrane protein n=1 Tax=Pediculus humanus subsp. corporis TaxID=121224 RepID=E0VX89_PEDHC|nr:uncharacterized protein Phum_PHUM497030 [Pediculus humanus corporis]EEB17995.1 hypothetical protein Phum_PHUM497030 [Pediculus humanus corporis]
MDYGPRTKRNHLIQTGNTRWHLFKIAQFLLCVAIIVVAIVIMLYWDIWDDFSEPFTTSDSTTRSPSSATKPSSGQTTTKSNLFIVTPVKTVPASEDDIKCPKIPEYKKDSDSFSLSNLLFIFPAVFTVLVIVIIEVFGHLTRDPILKVPTIVYLFIMLILSLGIFTVSTEATYRRRQYIYGAIALFSGKGLPPGEASLVDVQKPEINILHL